MPLQPLSAELLQPGGTATAHCAPERRLIPMICYVVSVPSISSSISQHKDPHLHTAATSVPLGPPLLNGGDLASAGDGQGAEQEQATEKMEEQSQWALFRAVCSGK